MSGSVSRSFWGESPAVCVGAPLFTSFFYQFVNDTLKKKKTFPIVCLEIIYLSCCLKLCINTFMKISFIVLKTD